MAILNKEPALVIGTVVTILVGAIATLSGNGFISDTAAGKATDLVNGLGQLLLLLAPLIATGLTRTQVYSPATVNQIIDAVAPAPPDAPPTEADVEPLDEPAPAPVLDPAAPVTDEPTDPPATVG